MIYLLLQSIFSVYVATAEHPSSDEELFAKLGIGPPRGRNYNRLDEIPSFMMELYRQKERVLGRNGATSVASFPATSTSSDNQVSDCRWQFEFAVTDLPRLDRILQSQMRIFKVKGSKQKETPYTVNVFHVLRKEDSDSTSAYKDYLISPYNSSLAVRLLDTQTLESRQSHWVAFEVADAVKVHQELEQQNMIFEIMYTPVNPVDVVPSSRGIRFTKSRGKQPSIVIFTDDGSNDLDSYDERNVRTAPDLQENNYDSSQSFCQRKELYVDFSRLGWDWIIAPPGFDAFMCSGVCNLTFSSKTKITNHAYLQSYMVSKHKNIPKPCCSPTKLSPITLIYFVDGNGIKMKEYTQMKVEQCGCE